jgi:fatty-acid peroxygenase
VPDAVPSRAVLDRSLGLLREGYRFVPDRRRRWGRAEDGAHRAVELRLLGERVLLVGGPDATRFFYDPSRFRRRDAVPPPLANTLFGEGSLHLHDGPTHLARKAMHLELLNPAAARDLAARSERYWDAAIRRWQDRPDDVVLFDEAVRVLGVTVCTWAGLPLTAVEAPCRIRDLATIVDGFGSVGPRHLRARAARRRTDRWVCETIRDVRVERILAPPGSALDVVSLYRDPDGLVLDDHTAAVELVNVIRPTVAVSWFVSFAGLALHRNPRWRERLARATDPALDGDLEAFVHEVRRVYPFAPVLGARARRPFHWRGHGIPEGGLVLLDLYGTNHDPELWPEPERFDPTRFLGRPPDPHSYLPQGGGDPAAGHRCAGERVTVELLKTAVRILARLRYTVPAQDLGFSLSRMPTRPRSGFRIRDVRGDDVPRD